MSSLVFSADYLLELSSKPLDAQEMIAGFVPPKHFEGATFANYIPDSNYPSQANALQEVLKFIASLQDNQQGSNSFFKKYFNANTSHGSGIYLDGGFGIGKTHLLASAFHQFDGAKVFLSFQELMFLVGLQTLKGVVASLQETKLLVIDELELDDPANTRITTNLLSQLFDSGVSILTSSNTPPGALGDGKFSVEDFRRELGSLTDRFTSIKIDGEDYRTLHHIGEGTSSTWTSSESELHSLFDSPFLDDKRVIDSDFMQFLDVLSKVHPMRIRSVLPKIDALVLRDVSTITHPHAALRFVYCIDKAYDNNILVMASSSVEPKDLWHQSYFTGGDTKKYLRTISRLKEMTHSGYQQLK